MYPSYLRISSGGCASPAVITMLISFDGGIDISPRIVRTASMTPWTNAICRSTAGSMSAGSGPGILSRMIVAPEGLGLMLCHSSSVTKGMIGCRRRSAAS